jgi:hypothetical protein
MPSYARQSSGGHALKKVTNTYTTLNDFLNVLESQVSDDVLSDKTQRSEDLHVTLKETFSHMLGF